VTEFLQRLPHQKVKDAPAFTGYRKPATISRFNRQFKDDYAAWQQRDLSALRIV
jgi:hypothetical protein